jgi:tetratricopeptide (TPR) repeat protein
MREDAAFQEAAILSRISSADAASGVDDELAVAEQAIRSNRLADAGAIVGGWFAEGRPDAQRLRLAAALEYRKGRGAAAIALLREALSERPEYAEARRDLIKLLVEATQFGAAALQIGRLSEAGLATPDDEQMKADLLWRAGDFEAALQASEKLLQAQPASAVLWVRHGDLLRTLGRKQESIAAYRSAIAAAPTCGEAWWGLANLKTAVLSPADLAEMRRAARAPALAKRDAVPLHFALGAALEDAREYEKAFAAYSTANGLQRRRVEHQATVISGYVDASIRLFDETFFASRAGQGSAATDPIFILGMPRSGSTLLEQILASHPQVEGTMELSIMPQLVQDLHRQTKAGDRGEYPFCLPFLSAKDLQRAGDSYIARTRPFRKTGRPLFIDKLPMNWMHVPLIRAALPNARIIDARRHPLDCCFSNYRQYFAKGYSFTYDLTELGLYYRDYVRLMDHVADASPGGVHRVIHERLVEEPEQEVRRLLAFIGVEFDENCLRFHENDRAVRTPSSEQVRKPINRDGFDRWRPFDPWLQPLRDALGELIDGYPSPAGSASKDRIEPSTPL